MQEISEKLSLLAAEKILDDIDDILDDKAKFIDQDHSKATYAKKIDKRKKEKLIGMMMQKNYWKNKWFISNTRSFF